MDEKSDDAEQRQGLRWSQEQRLLPYGVEEHHPLSTQGHLYTPCGVCRVQSLFSVSYFQYLPSAPTYAYTHIRERQTEIQTEKSKREGTEKQRERNQWMILN